MAKKEKLIIIDGNALLHRAFHAVPPLSTSDGRLVNAVFGFTTILMRVMKELTPKYVAVTFDLKGPTFRHEEYAEYKAHRKKQPDELYAQLDPIKEVVRAFQIPIYEIEGYEADDVIGTLAKQLDSDDAVETYIVTGDLDTLQLVDDNTKVYTLKRSIADTVIYDEAGVREKFGGLGPEQMVDYKALRGDPSDNIPGVRGIGEKTAIELLTQFTTLDELYEHYHAAETITKRVKGLLEEHKDDALLSRQLATIVTDVPITFSLEDLEFAGVNREAAVAIFQDMEFKTLLGKIPELEKKLKINTTEPVTAQSSTPRSNTYQLVTTEAELKKLVEALGKQKAFAFDTETSGLDPWQDELVGLSVSWGVGQAFYIDWETCKDCASMQELKKIFAKKSIKKVGHNIKFDTEVLLMAGFDVHGIYFDTMIAAYLLNPGERQLKLDTLAFREFGHQMIPIEQLLGKKGKDQKTMKDLTCAEINEYACEDADFTWRLYKVLLEQIKEADMLELLTDIEMLVDMEAVGVLIDTDFLNKLRVQLKKQIQSIETKIYELAGEKFNIASPKQLKVILFEKLEIPTDGLKKTKTGISTAASELEKMRGLHPIIDMISEYRELTKLTSTYIDALPKLINPRTNRVHTSFNQTIAATGRLSSTDPNLQNIPIRTELGRKIRNAFVADDGYELIAADYSQVELRVAAHLSQDKNMIEVFANNGDIHTITASYIHDVPVDNVTKDMRYKAKEINFGVLYGMGAYGLAQRTGIPRAEAQEFITRYFEQFADLKQYRDIILTTAQEAGYVETLFGRRRYLPDLHSGVAMVRKAAERAAINMPIQGTSADIMKLAMIKVHEVLTKDFPEVSMLMQVHDELVFEVPKNDVKKVAAVIKQHMESVTTLDVPLLVEVNAGTNWHEMKVVE